MARRFAIAAVGSLVAFAGSWLAFQSLLGLDRQTSAALAGAICALASLRFALWAQPAEAPQSPQVLVPATQRVSTARDLGNGRGSSAPRIPGQTDLSLLSVGRYATIYRARLESVGRQVAVKIENLTIESDRDRARFLREARAIGKMSSHPHVVDLFDAGITEDNHPYLVMELCAGSYQDLMPLRPAVVRDIGVKIADALADAHERGIVHRDVKPGNILVGLFGEPVLSDFGLAILAEQRDPHITLDVMAPAYAPPEAFRRAEAAPPGDVYALCATLYALLTGSPPRWQHTQPAGLLALIELFAEPIPDVEGCPPELVKVLRLGMNNDPAQRPTARSLEEMLIAVDFNNASRLEYLPEEEPQGKKPSGRHSRWELLAEDGSLPMRPGVPISVDIGLGPLPGRFQMLHEEQSLTVRMVVFSAQAHIEPSQMIFTIGTARGGHVPHRITVTAVADETVVIDLLVYTARENMLLQQLRAILPVVAPVLQEVAK